MTVIDFPALPAEMNWPYRIEQRGNNLYIVREADDTYWLVAKLEDNAARDVLWAYIDKDNASLDRAFSGGVT